MSATEYKTAWVRAEMWAETKKIKKKRQIGSRNVTKTRGLFKKESYQAEEPIFEEYDEWVHTGEISDTYIDIEIFSQKIMAACNALAAEGYDIVHISDIISGRYQYKTKEFSNRPLGHLDSTAAGGWGYGYGYSVTDGVVITAKLKTI